MMTLKRKMKHSQSVLIIVLAGLVIVGSTLAILSTVLNTKANVFTSTGKVNVAVIENGDLSSPKEKGEGIENLGAISTTPTTPTTKQVQIKNLDKEDYRTTNTYVRVRIVPSFVYTEGAHVGETAAQNISVYTNGEDIDGIHLNLSNNTNWVAQTIAGETYYFYKEALAPNVTSENLLESVYYKGTIPSNTHLELEILVDGVSANGGSGDKFTAAIEAWNLSSIENVTSLFSNVIKKN